MYSVLCCNIVLSMFALGRPEFYYFRQTSVKPRVSYVNLCLSISTVSVSSYIYVYVYLYVCAVSLSRCLCVCVCVCLYTREFYLHRECVWEEVAKRRRQRRRLHAPIYKAGISVLSGTVPRALFNDPSSLRPSLVYIFSILFLRY